MHSGLLSAHRAEGSVMSDRGRTWSLPRSCHSASRTDEEIHRVRPVFSTGQVNPTSRGVWVPELSGQNFQNPMRDSLWK